MKTLELKKRGGRKILGEKLGKLNPAFSITKRHILPLQIKGGKERKKERGSPSYCHKKEAAREEGK